MSPMGRAVWRAGSRAHTRSGLGPGGGARNELLLGAQQIFDKHLSVLSLWDYKIIFGERGSALVGTDGNQSEAQASTYSQS